MSASVAIVLIGVAGVLALGAWGVSTLLAARDRSARESSGRLDALLAEAGRAREASQSVDRRFDELRRAVESRVGAVEQRLTAGQQSVAEHLGQSGQVMRELGERLGRLHEASQKIEKLAGDVTRLEDLLKPPKLRGTLGEMFLEQALSQALPPGAFATQYPLGDGAIVDAVVFIQERLVAIDSKFPLENFRRARELEDEGDRRRARTQFGRDVRKHVDSIAEKYIRPACGTCDFAFMYVPAEAVYAEIVADGDDGAVADYAAGKRVIPVSPRLLYAYLSTVALGLRGLELQENAREVHQNLADLARLCDRVGGPLDKLGAHLTNAHKQFEETARAFDRFANRLSTISEKAESASAAEGTQLPILPPPS
jgi:DNA recombination protein RmuC